MKQTTVLYFAALGASIFSGISCRSATPARVDERPATVAAEPPRIAVVPVHISYVLRALTPSFDSLFPARDSLDRAACENAAGLVCHKYVYERDPLRIAARGTRISVETRLRYRAQVGVPGARLASCGYGSEAMRRAALSLSTSLYWRKDWKIGAHETQLSAQLLDACRVTALSLDATPALRRVIDDQLALFAAQIDTALPTAADFGPLADSLWRSFREPTALDSAGTLWMLFEPEAVRVAPLEGLGTLIKTAITLYARPRIVAGRKPSVRPLPLPALALGAAPTSFDVPVSVELPFADVERRATPLLAAETRGQSVRVDSVHVTARADTVRIELDVSGSLRGRLALVSPFRWDAATRELRLDDVEWTLDSRGALSRVKSTLAAPLIGRAIRRATMGGRIPLGEQLDSARVEMLRKLHEPVAPGITMGGNVTSLSITGVHATPNAFVVRARLVGQAGVTIQ